MQSQDLAILGEQNRVMVMAISMPVDPLAAFRRKLWKFPMLLSCQFQQSLIFWLLHKIPKFRLGASGRVAVTGWWASWPVEEINGVVISDRAVHEIPDRVWPPAQLEVFAAELTRLQTERRALEQQVARVRPGNLDADVIDERARVALNLLRPDEVLIELGAVHQATDQVELRDR